jgi:hypothetical protein
MSLAPLPPWTLAKRARRRRRASQRRQRRSDLSEALHWHEAAVVAQAGQPCEAPHPRSMT